MILIRRGNKDDFDRVNKLLRESELFPIYIEQLDDVCLVAEENGEIVGFIWSMVSTGNKIAYIDHFAVKSTHRGLGPKLATSILSLGKDIGVEDVITYVPDHGLPNDLGAFKINFAIGLVPQRVRYHCFTGKLIEVKGITHGS